MIGLKRSVSILSKLFFTGMLLHVLSVARAQNTTLISTGTKLTMSGNVQLVSGAGKIINNGTIGGTTGTLVFAAR